MKLIYISGPYSNGVTDENIHNAIDAGDALAREGFVVIIPHLNALWAIVHPHEYEFWLAQDMELLRRCDVVLRLPGESPGADREVALAEELGLTVYHNIDALLYALQCERWEGENDG